MRDESRARRLEESDALHGRARAMIHAFEGGGVVPDSFDALAVDLARFQARSIAGYGRLCAAHRVEWARMERAADAPAVPTDAFRLAHVFAFDAADAVITFRTSGTTSGTRGVHAMRDVGTYDAAAVAFGRAMLSRGLAPPVPVLVLGPSADEAPDSSLAHMCALFARELARERVTSAERTFFMRGGRLDVDGLRARVAQLSPGPPAIVLATSFALVHLLDTLRGEALPLPVGSRLMQTGGFKGKSREVAPAELRRGAARTFCIPERAVVGEYGMTELSTQFWEAAPADDRARQGGQRIYVEPPWARVVPVDPETLAPVVDGQVGIARIEDLANVDSAFAIVTQDRVRRLEGGFELLGRVPGAAPRGCSIAVDEMLSPSAHGA
jgi:hypothetical protein